MLLYFEYKVRETFDKTNSTGIIIIYLAMSYKWFWCSLKNALTNISNNCHRGHPQPSLKKITIFLNVFFSETCELLSLLLDIWRLKFDYLFQLCHELLSAYRANILQTTELPHELTISIAVNDFYRYMSIYIYYLKYLITQINVSVFVYVLYKLCVPKLNRRISKFWSFF